MVTSLQKIDFELVLEVTVYNVDSYLRCGSVHCSHSKHALLGLRDS